MSAGDDELFSTMIRVESKDLFVDLRKNKGGVYLKLSERYGKSRNSVLIPASGIVKLKNALETILSQVSPQHIGTEHSKSTSGSLTPTRNVYVSDLSWSTTGEDLANHFRSVGQVVQATILQRMRRDKAQSLGCGVVEFKSADDAARAIQVMSGTELDGRVIKCRIDRQAIGNGHTNVDAKGGNGGNGNGKHNKKEADAPDGEPRVVDMSDRTLVPTKVFVTGLPWNTQSEDLLAIFGTVGKVVTAELAVTKKGRSLGRAVVEFSSAESAQKAVAELNGRVVENRPMTVREYYE